MDFYSSPISDSETKLEGLYRFKLLQDHLIFRIETTNLMIDHSYKIVTKTVARTASRIEHFVAELSEVYITVDGKQIDANFPGKTFFGKNQTSVMIQASDTLRHWLAHRYPAL